jgi:DNA primase catalytic subunit
MNCNIIEIGGQKNGYFTRNIFIDSKDLKSSIKQFDGDIYSTIYKYDSTDQNTANFIAPLYLDLDIDDIENNFIKIKQDLLLVIRRLKTLFYLEDKDIELYFSGSKGFHILINHKIFGFKPSRDINKYYKKIATELKTYTINKRSPLLGRMTTERFIYNNAGLKNSFTMKSQLKMKDKFKINKKPLNRMQTHSFANSENKLVLNDYDKFKTMKVNANKGHIVPIGKDSSNMAVQSVNVKYEVNEHLLDSIEEMNIVNNLLYHYLFHKTSKENLQYIINVSSSKYLNSFG